MLSVVIPTYNEYEIITEAYEVISGVLNTENIKHEIIFVDDGSKDGSWDIISNLANKHDNIRGVKFSRNFGKESAILAGLDESKGECAVVMDCDLQHPADKLTEMYRLWQDGYEIVEGRKNSRGDESFMHTVASHAFYKIISKAMDADFSNASDFKLLDKKVITALLNMPERNTFFRALSSWVGYKTTIMYYDVNERKYGKSKWSTWKLIKYAIKNITSFTSYPMHIITVIGGIMLVLDVVFGAIALIQKFMGTAIDGFTTVILLLLLIGSLILISLGIIGFYISKIYEEIKNRPRYLISDRR